jgi:hypothetical protein
MFTFPGNVGKSQISGSGYLYRGPTVASANMHVKIHKIFFHVLNITPLNTILSLQKSKDKDYVYVFFNFL